MKAREERREGLQNEVVMGMHNNNIEYQMKFKIKPPHQNRLEKGPTEMKIELQNEVQKKDG